MNKIALLLLTVVLVGCATSYQKSSDFFFSDKTGYSDYQIDQNKFSVTFTGNQYTSNDQVMAHAIKRASELTLQHGYTHFAILNKKDAGRLECNSTQYVTVVNHLPGVTLHIECYQENIPAGALNAYDY